jgi:hypothetical protein
MSSNAVGFLESHNGASVGVMVGVVELVTVGVKDAVGVTVGVFVEGLVLVTVGVGVIEYHVPVGVGVNDGINVGVDV